MTGAVLKTDGRCARWGSAPPLFVEAVMTDEEFTKAVRDTGLDAKAIGIAAQVSRPVAARWLNGITRENIVRALVAASKR